MILTILGPMKFSIKLDREVGMVLDFPKNCVSFADERFYLSKRCRPDKMTLDASFHLGFHGLLK